MKTKVQCFFKRAEAFVALLILGITRAMAQSAAGAEAFVALLILGITRAMAQSAAGIDQATAEVSSYVDPVSNLIIAIGAVVGLIGGVRVYIKWQSGDQDTQKAIMGWFGACLFLILVGVVIKAFFV